MTVIRENLGTLTQPLLDAVTANLTEKEWMAYGIAANELELDRTHFDTVLSQVIASKTGVLSPASILALIGASASGVQKGLRASDLSPTLAPSGVVSTKAGSTRLIGLTGQSVECLAASFKMYSPAGAVLASLTAVTLGTGLSNPAFTSYCPDALEDCYWLTLMSLGGVGHATLFKINRDGSYQKINAAPTHYDSVVTLSTRPHLRASNTYSACLYVDSAENLTYQRGSVTIQISKTTGLRTATLTEKVGPYQSYYVTPKGNAIRFQYQDPSSDIAASLGIGYLSTTGSIVSSTYMLSKVHNLLLDITWPINTVTTYPAVGVHIPEGRLVPWGDNTVIFISTHSSSSLAASHVGLKDRVWVINRKEADRWVDALATYFRG